MPIGKGLYHVFNRNLSRDTCQYFDVCPHNAPVKLQAERARFFPQATEKA
jgi:hypothetical protein